MLEPLYGPQTQLSVKNFAAAGRLISDVPEFIRNFALIKRAAAVVNVDLGRIDPARGQAIQDACIEVFEGRQDSQFPTSLVVGGGGTATNMNFNEVIATRASQLCGLEVHPNDHVNASQSTNDTVPSAIALTLISLVSEPVDALRALAAALEAKGHEYGATPYLGRTCLQDAVTAHAGSTLCAQARAVRRVAQDIVDVCERLSALPLGATVLGSGIGAPGDFPVRVIAALQQLVIVPISESEDRYDSLANFDPYAAIADAGARAAVVVQKVASDLRLRASGPHGGFAEITLPALQAGSSIMPGKVNPVAPEYAMQLAFRVRGAAHTVSLAVAAGELELNVMELVILDALLDIFRDLTVASRTLQSLSVEGLVWDGPRREENLRHRFDALIVLAETAGYQAASLKAGERTLPSGLDATS